jgi:signal transduction histidine kinase
MRSRPRLDGPSRLAATLRDQKNELVLRWTRRVLDDPMIPEADRLSGPELRDHIPKLIDNLADCLEAVEGAEASGRAIGAGGNSREHARDRIESDYSLTEAMRELSHFRAAILDLCATQGAVLDSDAARCLHAAIDQSMISGSDEMERAAVAKFGQEAAFRERFIGILGHDLRNPLQAIRFAAASLLERDDTTAPQTRLMHRIAMSADHMGRMIAGLLDVTRARLGGGIPIEPKLADLRVISRQSIDELEIAHPFRTIQLDVQGDVRGVWDPDRIAQVVSNLVGNAIDYSPVDTPVRVDLRVEGTDVLLVVNNRGPTIAPEMMAQLFDPFRRGSQGGAVGQGLGLGLFIAQKIVEAHGGAIAVASTPEEGTTFTVRLPHST